MSAVVVEHLTIRYGQRDVVHDCTWRAPAQAVTALIGPNGAGKTTTVEACVGLRTPTSGRLRVDGADPTRWSPDQRAHVGVMLQGGGLYPSARIGPWLAMLARLFTNPWPTDDLMNRLGIDPRWPQIRRLSGGQLQLVKLASALIGRPRVVFLDEPTAGLDLHARTRLYEVVAELRSSGTSVILTTHDLVDVERLADHVVVMQSGVATTAGTLAELTQQTAGLRFRARSGLNLQRLRTVLPVGLEVVEDSPGQYLVSGEVSPSVMAVVTQWCADEGITPTSLTTGTRSLADLLELGDQP